MTQPDKDKEKDSEVPTASSLSPIKDATSGHRPNAFDASPRSQVGGGLVSEVEVPEEGERRYGMTTRNEGEMTDVLRGGRVEIGLTVTDATQTSNQELTDAGNKRRKIGELDGRPAAMQQAAGTALGGNSNRTAPLMSWDRPITSAEEFESVSRDITRRYLTLSFN